MALQIHSLYSRLTERRSEIGFLIQDLWKRVEKTIWTCYNNSSPCKYSAEYWKPCKIIIAPKEAYKYCFCIGWTQT